MKKTRNSPKTSSVEVKGNATTRTAFIRTIKTGADSKRIT